MAPDIIRIGLLNKQENNAEVQTLRLKVRNKRYVKFENKIPKFQGEVLSTLIDLSIQN